MKLLFARWGVIWPWLQLCVYCGVRVFKLHQSRAPTLLPIKVLLPQPILLPFVEKCCNMLILLIQDTK